MGAGNNNSSLQLAISKWLEINRGYRKKIGCNFAISPILLSSKAFLNINLLGSIVK